MKRIIIEQLAGQCIVRCKRHDLTITLTDGTDAELLEAAHERATEHNIMEHEGTWTVKVRRSW